MNTTLKVGVVVAPFLAVFLVIRSCAGTEAGRWRDRVAEVDPAARIAVDVDGLIVIAPKEEFGRRRAEEIVAFRRALAREYGDLLGADRDVRMVAILFSRLDQLQAFYGRRLPDPERGGFVHGFTDPGQGAIYLPPGSSLDTLRHETVHWLMEVSHGGTVRYSPWLMEGLAQLFETYRPDGPPPALSAATRLAMRGLPGATVDVDRLLAIQDYAAFTGAQGGRNYLEALVLTAFLFHERDRELLRRYIEIERRTTQGRAAEFRRLYAHRSPEFRGDLRAFVASGGR